MGIFIGMFVGSIILSILLGVPSANPANASGCARGGLGCIVQLVLAAMFWGGIIGMVKTFFFG